MSLWGNNDNLLSPGTVSFNYGNKVVTGNGTNFGAAGAAQVGDVIRFGAAFTGTTGYFGDAVITKIFSTTSLRVDSIAGLSFGEITNTAYQISQSPKYLPTDSAQNQSSGSIAQFGIKLETETNGTRVAVGATIVTVVGNASGSNVAAGDQVRYGPDINRYQAGTVHSLIGLSTVVLQNGVPTTTLRYHTPNNAATAPVGFSTIIVTERAYGDDPDIDPVSLIKAGDAVGVGTYTGTITTVNQNFLGQRSLTLGSVLTQEVPAGAVVDISRGIAPNTFFEFGGVEQLDGKESQVVGISQTGAAIAQGTSYQIAATGWVGVTTYTDNEGVARVKSETFVAMSGIHTGNTPYPPAT
jgi:co-chaperonin GroES (HSP10)